MDLTGFTKPEQPSDPAIFAGFRSGADSIDGWVAKFAAKAKQRGTAVLYVTRPVLGDSPTSDGADVVHARKTRPYRCVNKQ